MTINEALEAIIQPEKGITATVQIEMTLTTVSYLAGGAIGAALVIIMLQKFVNKIAA